jgi:plastocyanin
MNRKTSTGLILGGALIVAAGYGATATQAATPPAPAHSSTMVMGHGMVMGHTTYRATGPVITISNYTFHAPKHVKKGATVTVTNKDGFTHTVTNRASLFSVRVPGHSSRTFKAPSTAGAYKFHCKIHSSMHGTLHVG